ncbi:probable protein phosphatase 2C 9 isoform X2 [Zingiber officinale]|uniref:probable protein phosphatase 2C 9 isoform X2 n=1 Tax=Zingiber officinale TaxID=94328 RepID=UPI001C4C01B6|nr:probable protein phosphatase 2C 9 isoform X2 [Zingiber officinale]
MLPHPFRNLSFDFCSGWKGDWGIFRLLAGPSLTVGKGRSSNSRTRISYGYSLLKGAADHPIEDYHVAKFINVGDQELGLFAIFDGHSGDSVPAYLQDHLFTNILEEEELWSDPDAAIRRAYERTDNEILSHSRDLGRGGSTAVTAILVNGTKLWVANVGDSRAVLARRGEAIQMSIDHEPNSERESIETRGGFVSNLPGDVARVNGQLAVSRAFGDKNLKAQVRSDPDVRVEDANSETELLILASDGVWKVLSNQEAVDLVRKIKNPLAAARRLTLEAFKRESKDDISCIVVRFNG